MAGQGEKPQPGDEVGSDRGGGQPGLVGSGSPGTGIGPGRCLWLARMRSSIAGVGPVAGFQERQLPRGGGVAERLAAPAGGLLEQRQLDPRMRAFTAHDDPHPVGPTGLRHVEQPGELGDIRTGTQVAVRVDRRGPHRVRDHGDGVPSIGNGWSHPPGS
jgi:hypothetical protein